MRLLQAIDPRFLKGWWLLLFLTANASAFNPPVDDLDGFKAEIHIAERIQVHGSPIPASIEIENQTGLPFAAQIEIHGIDGWKTQFSQEPAGTPGESSTLVTRIEPNQRSIFPCIVHPATDSLIAHYPIHANITIATSTGEVGLHPIAVIEVTAVQQGRGKGITRKSAGVLPGLPFLLKEQQSVAFEIHPDGLPSVSLPPDWTGMDDETGAILERSTSVRRGERTLPALAIHPPFKKAPGCARLTWRVQLPRVTPITFGADIAIRDIHPGEPESDGVTFRVLVNHQTLFEKHTATKVWEEVRVDLSRFAGREVEISLESDVGPNRDSTCDLSYWGSPWIYSGDLPSKPEETLNERLEVAKRHLSQSLSSRDKLLDQPSIDHREATDIYSFGEEGEVYGVAIVPGRFGILDAAWAIGKKESVLGCEGFQVQLDGTSPLDFLSGFKWIESKVEGNGYRVLLEKGGRTHFVSLDIHVSSAGLKLDWDSDLPITDLSIGQFDRKASQIYLGVGNVIRNPLSAFTLEADGHRLATRHIGLDFEKDFGLVMACSNPPDKFVANPDSNDYSLHTHQPGSFYLVPSESGAFDAVLKYRRLASFQKAPGVDRLAGCFTFDLWGGGYAEVDSDLDRAARYGLTDSVVVFHNWQRWGYDYRLPDIYPPNPQFGTIEEFKNLRQTCQKHGMLFAPHDNYIDFYPDAEGFSYDHICFDSAGNPIKGWMNFGPGAQAYRFRPDAIGPFLERNLNGIREGFNPDAYFIDVFSSIGAFDYWGREGDFHGSIETIRHWNNAFDRIRETLGGNAPQISESGTDWLVGHLDGAQCNHLRIAPENTSFSWRIDCEDHERIPWQDLAMHEAFVLQGVGYPHRYNSGQDPYLHGIDSDDYLCDEVLTGHAPMVSNAFGRATVRKYWLLHDFLKEIAGVAMTKVEFVGGDIHHQRVAYSNDAKVWANRGNGDWPIEGDRVLPPFGFWAEGPTTQIGVLKIDNRIVEMAKSPSVYYADGRLVDCQGIIPLAVSLKDFQSEGNREYRMVLDWKTLGELPDGFQPFVHFTIPGPYGYHKTLFQAQGPWMDLTEFPSDVFQQEVKVVIPADLESNSFSIRAGIYSPFERERKMLLGNRDSFGLVHLGELEINPESGNARATPSSPPSVAECRDLSTPVDFGWCQTSVGVRAVVEAEEVRVIPLPDGKSVPFRFHLPTFGLSQDVAVVAETPEGVSHEIDRTKDGDFLQWQIDPQVFCYHILEDSTVLKDR